jgi:hypothetical protein
LGLFSVPSHHKVYNVLSVNLLKAPLGFTCQPKECE